MKGMFNLFDAFIFNQMLPDTGTAHCADMYPPRAKDPPGLPLARAKIDENIGKWLAAYQPAPPAGSTPAGGDGGSSAASLRAACAAILLLLGMVFI